MLSVSERMIYVNLSLEDSWHEKPYMSRVCEYTCKSRRSQRVPSQWSHPSLYLCAHTELSPPSSTYGPLCRCDHFRHEVCLHLITVLITDDLSLIEWVCSCTINLKAQWTVRGHSKNKTTLFCVQREQALSVWHPSWTIFKGKTSSKPQKLWYCK